MSDKEAPEVYQHFNSTAARHDGSMDGSFGTVVDISEIGMGCGREQGVIQTAGL